MHPVVAKIVSVLKRRTRLAAEISKTDFGTIKGSGLIADAVAVEQFEVPVPESTDFEFVEMRAGPSHHGLENAMQIGMVGVKRHDKPPPYRRLDIIEQDVNVNAGVKTGHWLG